MVEPLVLPLRAPTGGWPRCARRVELIGDLTLDQAAFALAERARLEHIGMVALFQGADLWAYPDQSVADIAAKFRRMRGMAEQRLLRALRPGPMRWTPHAKLAVVLAARELGIDRRDLACIYGLSAAELEDWERRFQQFGLDGLKATQVRALRLSPPEPDAVAAAHFTPDFTPTRPEAAHG